MAFVQQTFWETVNPLQVTTSTDWVSITQVSADAPRAVYVKAPKFKYREPLPEAQRKRFGQWQPKKARNR